MQLQERAKSLEEDLETQQKRFTQMELDLADANNRAKQQKDEIEEAQVTIEELTQENIQLTKDFAFKESELKEAVKTAEVIVKEQSTDNQVLELNKTIASLEA